MTGRHPKENIANILRGTGKVMLALLLMFALGQLSAPELQAQEKRKSELEKVNEKKNKSNRRLKRRGDKGKSNRQKLRTTRFKTRSRQGEKSYKGDITGRKVVTKTSPRRSSAGKAPPNPYAGRPKGGEGSRFKARRSDPRFSRKRNETAGRGTGLPRSASKGRERAWKGNAAGRVISTRSKRTSYTGKSQYQRFPGSARSITRDPERPKKKTRIVPRSVSGANRIRKGRSPYSSFRRQTAWEKAYKGDITGRPFRTKRTVERPIIQKPRDTRYSKGGRKDRPYKGGTLGGGFRTATRPSERAWKNDISGTKLRKRTSKRPKFNGNYYQTYPFRQKQGERAFKGKIKGSGYKSVSSRKERPGQRIQGRKPPGEGTRRGISFQGNIKGGKPLKGGGSVSGRRWNNQGRAIQGRGTTGQDSRTARFQGNIKGGKPLKGGGSISGRRWNNQGRAVQGRGATGQDNRIARFQGNVKGGKPLKGGGSISGRRWNNQGRPVQGRGTTGQDSRTARFQGNIKGGKPLKGGGSISGRRWNNQGRAVQGRGATGQDNRIARFQGNIKGGKPLKGGGSISGKRWNNNGTPLQRKGTTRQDNNVAKFQGNIKGLKPFKGGGSVSRNNWNNDGKPITKERLRFQDMDIAVWKGRTKRKSKEPSSETKKATTFTGRTKPFIRGKYDGFASEYRGEQKRKFGYVHNPNSADEALKVREPEKNVRLSAQFQGRTKTRRKYVKNKNAADESLRVVKPGKNETEAGNYRGFHTPLRYLKNKQAAEESLKARAPGTSYAQIKEYRGTLKRTMRFTKNPNSADGALKGIGPSRASIKASNYQGNIKMSKKSIRNTHPSFKYNDGRDDSNEFKKGLFNLRLFWAKLFKKNENQPQHLKSKERKPRFDKREQGLWYD